MKKFLLISFVFVLIYLVLRNTDTYIDIYKRITEEFGKSFKAATFVEKF